MKFNSFVRRVLKWPPIGEDWEVLLTVRCDANETGYTEIAYCVSKQDAAKILASPTVNTYRLTRYLEAGEEFNEALRKAGYQEKGL